MFRKYQRNVGYYAIIPVRGGSKGIPHKNVKPFFAGLSLTEIAVQNTRAVDKLQQVIVSSDSTEILQQVERYNIKALKRPDYLATATAQTIDVVLYHINQMQLQVTDTIILLQATSPFRNDKHITNAIAKYEHLQQTTLISVVKAREHPNWMFTLTDTNRLEPYTTTNNESTRRQDQLTLYRPNGAIYISTVANLLAQHSFYQKQISGFEMTDIESFDIDEPIDWEIGQYLATKYLI